MDDETQLDDEVWKPVPDTEGRYEVSNLGRVRSLVVGCRHGSVPRRTPLVMAPFNNKPGGSGYWVVNLRVGGRVKCRCVSELVLTAFVGPRPSPAHDAAHADGDRNENRLSNLQWATKKENAAHKRLHGTDRTGRHCAPAAESGDSGAGTPASDSAANPLPKIAAGRRGGNRHRRSGTRVQILEVQGVVPWGEEGIRACQQRLAKELSEGEQAEKQECSSAWRMP